MHTIAALAVLLAALGAQTFVVDPAGGPGVSFTSLNAAIAGVPDGSTLVVRAGTYPKVVIHGKGLTVLCDPGVQVQAVLDWYLTVSNCSATQPVTVRGLKPLGPTAFQVVGAQAPVCIDGQGSTMALSGAPIYQSVTIQQSAYVVVKACAVAMVGPSLVNASQVMFENCTFQGTDKFWLGPSIFVAPAPGIVVTNSRVQMVNCSATGGSGDAANPSEPGVRLDASSELRLLRGGSCTGGSGAAGVAGLGQLRLDPAVTVASTAGGTIVTTAAMPSVITTDAPPGGTMTAAHASAAAAPFVVVIALPGPLINVPGVLSPLGFDPQQFVVQAFGVGPTSGFTTLLPLPGVSTLVGSRVVWQSAQLGATQIEASNPSPAVVR